MSKPQTFPSTPNAQDIHQSGERLSPPSDFVGYFRQYARERPEVVALWCFGIGFVLGWKLKPW